MARTITWLHLSDLHARRRTGWDSSQITKSLVIDLKKMQTEQGLRPDFIFVTGDVVFGVSDKENMVDQYQLARHFLDAVRTAFEPEIPIRDLYIVPGNHDVDRGEITPDQTDWLRHPDRILPEIIRAMSEGKKQWRTWLDRLANYRNFLTTYNLLHLTPDDPHLIWGDAREMHGIRVGIAGLNSAWSCADKEDKAKLWFGAEWQIQQLKQRMGPVDFEFALFHHPGNWFTVHEDPVAMRRIRQEFTIILHGHEHQEWVEPDIDGRLVLSAGACYESSWMANGYSFGKIDLEQQSGGIWLRQWDQIGRGWVLRDIANKTQNGHWPLLQLPWIKKLDSRTLPSKSEQVTSVEVLPLSPGESAEEHFTKRYCQHVINQHDVLELFGCDIPKELQRHQLSVAYVSLNLVQEDEESLQFESSTNLTKSHKSQAKLESEEESKEIGDQSAAIEFVLDEISESTGRLLINGPAGAGKSTLMRWCAIHAAQQILQGLSSYDSKINDIEDGNLYSSSSWRRKIPFLIRLRDCSTGRLPSAKDLPSC